MMALAGLLVPVGQAGATICASDTVPAATLLLPYFEVNLDNPNGLTTLFAINNAAATAALTHVVIWSDLSVPVFSFNVYLTGYDMQTINLRDIIVNGNVPETASLGQDPNDTISPKGLFSQDVNFASCNGRLPEPQLSPSLVAHLQAALTGHPSPLLHNLCLGQALGDNVARGFVTVDTVNGCTSRFPDEPGYFAPNLSGDVTDQNLLWGNWFIVNVPGNYAQGSNLVPVEADGGNPGSADAGRYTFYGRFDNWSGVDHREPLATTFAVKYFSGGPFTGGTDLLVWRDPKVVQGAFDCPVVRGRPSWYPQAQEGIVIFDEQEHPALPETCPFDQPSQCPPLPPFTPFPAATQRVHVGGDQFPVPFAFGWFYLDLNLRSIVSPFVPPVDPAAAQAWVVSTATASGHFAVTTDAFRLDSACTPIHFVPHL